MFMWFIIGSCNTLGCFLYAENWSIRYIPARSNLCNTKYVYVINNERIKLFTLVSSDKRDTFKIFLLKIYHKIDLFIFKYPNISSFYSDCSFSKIISSFYEFMYKNDSSSMDTIANSKFTYYSKPRNSLSKWKFCLSNLVV
jgi:hypothetical protein